MTGHPNFHGERGSMICQGEHFVDVDGIKTFVKVVGKGAPLLIVHGGPGFSHDYLVDPLRFLTENRMLIFYDQPGCGKTELGNRTPSPVLTYKHFLSFARLISGGARMDLLVHSWGTLVVLGALTERTDPAQPIFEFGQAMFVSPVAVTNTNYATASLNLIRRMPESVLMQLEKAAHSDENGDKIMELILPYYYTKFDTKPDGPFNLNKATYLTVNAQLTEFDYSDQLKQLKNISVVVGEDDFTTLDLIDELISAASSCHVIKSTGHFPFHEAKEEFQQLANDVFTR